MEKRPERNPRRRFEYRPSDQPVKNRVAAAALEKAATYSLWRQRLVKKIRGKLLQLGGRSNAFLLPAGKDFSLSCGYSALRPDYRPIDTAAFEFCRGGFKKLPFKNAAFDFLLSFDLPERISRSGEFLAEASRILKRGGEFVLAVPNPRGLAAWMGKPVADRGKTTRPQGRPVWEKLFDAAGFEVLFCGTDALWESARHPGAPSFTHGIWLSGVSNLFPLLEPYFPWKFGENLVFWLRKK